MELHLRRKKKHKKISFFSPSFMNWSLLKVLKPLQKIKDVMKAAAGWI